MMTNQTQTQTQTDTQTQTAAHTHGNGPVWSARCKSGYQWDTGKRTRVLGRVVYGTCKQVTGRGELMCEDCKQLITLARRAERMANAARAVVRMMLERAEVR